MQHTYEIKLTVQLNFESRLISLITNGAIYIRN